MEIVLSTHNPSKAEQIKAVFANSSILVLTLDDVGIAGEANEDGQTLQENALKKAMFVHYQKPGTWAMADDTGIFIDALNGKPGVLSSRWADESMGIEEKVLWILKQLEGFTDRSATFRTVVSVVSPEGEQYFFTGEARGQLLKSPRTKPQPKMPYSPIFMPDGVGKAWSEMSVDEENKISHRGKAFRQALEFLQSQ